MSAGPKALERYLRRQLKPKLPEDAMNRSSFRAGGLQGRRGSQFVDSKIEPVPGIHEGTPAGKWHGPKRGSFLGTAGKPAILISHAYGARDRKIRKLFLVPKTGRTTRTIQRMRAAGELDEVEGRLSFADV